MHYTLTNGDNTYEIYSRSGKRLRSHTFAPNTIYSLKNLQLRRDFREPVTWFYLFEHPYMAALTHPRLHKLEEPNTWEVTPLETPYRSNNAFEDTIILKSNHELPLPDITLEQSIDMADLLHNATRPNFTSPKPFYHEILEKEPYRCLRLKNPLTFPSSKEKERILCAMIMHSIGISATYSPPYDLMHRKMCYEIINDYLIDFPQHKTFIQQHGIQNIIPRQPLIPKKRRIQYGMKKIR